jgi:PAS domain S-box-containing protein
MFPEGGGVPLPMQPEVCAMAAQLPVSVLYVDDDAENRHTLTYFLEREGFRTREAATGAEALRLLADKPDAIILDVGLPDMDGFEVCRRIKAHPATAGIPVLHVSGRYVGSEDRSHGLDEGADAYLTKPVEPREVVATLRALLRVRAAEEAAREAAGQWQATFDAIHDPLWLLDAGGRVLRCNRAMADLLGRPAADVQGREHRQLLREALGSQGESLADLLRQGPEPEGREVSLGDRWFLATTDAVAGEGGGAAGQVQLLADVTRRKALEAQLVQAQKMEAVGRLAGGVAHDFNNLLLAVTGNLSLALGLTAADDPRREALVLAEKAAWRAAELTNQLLRFSRRGRVSAGPVDVGACVHEVLSLLRPALEARIDVVAFAAPDLWRARAHAGQVSQVLMNLCLNARDAMRQGGRLTVTAHNAVLGSPGPDAPLGARAGEFVRLRVADTGEGIAPENLSRIYDPFFTTKGPGQGTGLGLAVAFGIVQEHGGWIECASEVGQGSSFTVYLPRHVEAAAEEAATQGT